MNLCSLPRGRFPESRYKPPNPPKGKGTSGGDDTRVSPTACCPTQSSQTKHRTGVLSRCPRKHRSTRSCPAMLTPRLQSVLLPPSEPAEPDKRLKPSQVTAGPRRRPARCPFSYIPGFARCPTATAFTPRKQSVKSCLENNFLKAHTCLLII